ncbi:helix-turn-helix transcriptional regulator [uncultured Clostridium sp.]|uniref:ArsR/SmtB family transcription factor n=1 Tax=uncultured Clostridium sp. TaxID=59620 RepID=UPI00258B8DCC|nr:metalloregulator ArsR/SmtB family transcription factor [uncultured Clostridium sp.]
MENDYKALTNSAELLKVLAHPVRLCIVRGLLTNGGCNVTFMQNCLDMPQSTISQHLQKLKSVGIIEGERNGLEINYRVVNNKVEKIIKALEI